MKDYLKEVPPHTLPQIMHQVSHIWGNGRGQYMEVQWISLILRKPSSLSLYLPCQVNIKEVNLKQEARYIWKANKFRVKEGEGTLQKKESYFCV